MDKIIDKIIVKIIVEIIVKKIDKIRIDKARDQHIDPPPLRHPAVQDVVFISASTFCLLEDKQYDIFF